MRCNSPVWSPTFLRVLVNKVVYHFHPPHQGDVIIFHYPKNHDLVYVKRVIGLPGDEIAIGKGKVYINDSPLSEPYVPGRTTGTLARQVISPDHYFVMGDNRSNSSDSRHWGTVPEENIIGRAWLSYWPPASWGLAPNYSLSSP